jgi:hypothetical protein
MFDEQGHTDQRLRLVHGPCHHLTLRVEVGPPNVARAPIADDLTGDPLIVREALGHHLVGPLPGRESRTESSPRINELIEGEIVVGDERSQLQRDPP